MTHSHKFAAHTAYCSASREFIWPGTGDKSEAFLRDREEKRKHNSAVMYILHQLSRQKVLMNSISNSLSSPSEHTVNQEFEHCAASGKVNHPSFRSSQVWPSLRWHASHRPPLAALSLPSSLCEGRRASLTDRGCSLPLPLSPL